MRQPAFIRREQRRLRRKFIKKLSTRSLTTVDSWVDVEFAKAAIPAILGLVISDVANLRAGNAFMLAGVVLTVLWACFVALVLLQVYGRWGDKYYMAITRRMLSEEYKG